jgi:DNA-binding SARP family transcriptional activator
MTSPQVDWRHGSTGGRLPAASELPVRRSWRVPGDAPDGPWDRLTPATDERARSAVAPKPLRLQLLGGFRVELADGVLVHSAWRRRPAKTLTKLLATHPDHALHRDQILEILWSDIGAASALNSFGKALHAARRALEPDLLPRATSSYLHLRDEMVVLDTEHVLIDADEFERRAENALHRESISEYETALAAYSGELLPEDRYADWSEERRRSLADLHVRLLLGLANALEQHGAYNQAADCFRSVLRHDPTREDVHRHLMRLYADLGTPHEALRQFHTCRNVLEREFNAVPERETEALYQELIANRVHSRAPAHAPQVELPDSYPLVNAQDALETPFVGRRRLLQLLHDQLTRAERGKGILILVSGEVGVGKTRLVAEFLREARQRGAAAFGATAGARTVARRGSAPATAPLTRVGGGFETGAGEQTQLQPALVHFAPSLDGRDRPPPFPGPNDGSDELRSLTAVTRLLTNLDGTRPVLVVLGDVRVPDAAAVAMLEHLGRLAMRNRWVMLGTVRDEALDLDGARRGLHALAAEGLCLQVEVSPLARDDCDRLVQALLPGGAVDASLLDRVYALSLGNPLLVEEVVQEMLEGEELVLSDRVWRNGSSFLPKPMNRNPAGAPRAGGAVGRPRTAAH